MNENEICVRPMRVGEEPFWGELRTALWPHCTAEDNQRDIADFRSGKSGVCVVFLAVSGDFRIGFAEIAERSVVDGADRDPAVYLEGWYVDPAFRRCGIGAKLVSAAADWAREQGYSCFGSDVELDNLASQRAHAALGFAEIGRVVNYLMRLN